MSYFIVNEEESDGYSEDHNPNDDAYYAFSDDNLENLDRDLKEWGQEGCEDMIKKLKRKKKVLKNKKKDLESENDISPQEHQTEELDQNELGDGKHFLVIASLQYFSD